MEWVKSKVGYYRHIAIATGSDALEVMFKRGDALAGEIGQSGFIPDAMVPLLCRRPSQGKKLAAQLVTAGLWDRVKGGYQIVDFADINSELVRLSERKQRDRDRKRAERAAAQEAVSDTSGPASVDVSTDSPQDRPGDSLLDQRPRARTRSAAAAADIHDAAAAADLPGSIDVLRSKLQAHTPLRGLRFDTLTAEQTDQLVDLLEVHGDDPLVGVAIATCRNPAPVHVTAFLKTWAALPEPGRRLQAVRQRYCDTHSTPLSPSGTCSSCASDQKAAR